MAKTTDTSERGLERLICTVLTGHPCDPPKADQGTEPQAGSGGVGWSCGSPQDYDRKFCVCSGHGGLQYCLDSPKGIRSHRN